MGSGKSTIGRLLAARLGWTFIDLDAAIEAREGRSVAGIFEAVGEAAFRRMESEMLRRVSKNGRVVVALGGGAFIDPANRTFIGESGVSVHLEVALDTVLGRIRDDGSRPLFRDPDRVAALYAERRPAYLEANIQLRTDGLPPETVTEQLLTLVSPS
jgi:shikimate kinase